MNNVHVVRIAAVMFHAADDFTVVVDSVRKHNTDVLCQLVANIGPLCQHLFTCQKLFRHTYVHKGVNLAIHHGVDVLIREATHIHLECLENLIHQIFGDKPKFIAQPTLFE